MDFRKRDRHKIPPIYSVGSTAGSTRAVRLYPQGRLRIHPQRPYPVRSSPRIHAQRLLFQLLIDNIPILETDLLFMDDYALFASAPSLADV